MCPGAGAQKSLKMPLMARGLRFSRSAPLFPLVCLPSSQLLEPVGGGRGVIC